MEFKAILKELKAGTFHPVYFLHGMEAFFIDQVTDYIEANALTEAEKAFNLTIAYGKEVDHLAIVDAARRYPMMAQRQVVILKEAQEMKELAKLQAYIEQPANTTILVIAHKHKRFNTNSKFGKSVKQHAVLMEAKPLYDNQVPDWISTYLKSKKLSIQPKAASLVAEYLGTNLSKVANELEKLAINLPAGTEINDKHIEEQIGISREYNVFELQRAIGTKDLKKANRIINYFAANPKKGPMVMVVSSLYNYFNKIYQLSFLGNASERDVMSTLKLRSAYFLKEYKLAARNFNRPRAEIVLSLLARIRSKSQRRRLQCQPRPGRGIDAGNGLEDIAYLVVNG